MPSLCLACGAFLLLCWSAPAYSNAPPPSTHGWRLGDSPVQSAVQFREIDSFWRGNASHIDFYNVKLEVSTTITGSTRSGAATPEMVLKVYLQDKDELNRVRERILKDRQLLPYRKASMKLEVPKLEFVHSPDATLEPSTCDRVWDGSVLFDSPWYHNIFHMHAKNIIPTALVLATSPSLVPNVGQCKKLPCVEQLPRRSLIHYVSTKQRALPLSNVQLAMFDEVADLSSLAGQTHCFRHLNWGYGGELTAINDYRHDYVHELRVLTHDVRRFAIEHFVQEAEMQRKLLHGSKDRSTASPRALWISRQPKDTKGMIQTGRNRWIQDPQHLISAWEAAGAEVDSCCDWASVTMDSMITKFAQADIIYGLHGAGLANAFYAKKGAVLVEVVGNYGGDSQFYARVAAAKHGDWLRVRIPRDNHVGKPVSEFIASCAIALWRNSSDWESACHSETLESEDGISLLRTTSDLLKIGDAEELPLDTEIAPCDASPRCIMEQLQNEAGQDMMEIFKAMAQRPKGKLPVRGSGAPGRRRHQEL